MGYFQIHVPQGSENNFNALVFFFELAKAHPDPVGKFRLLLAGIYSARAVVELILEAVDKEQLVGTRDDVRLELTRNLPWYDLIERIRIHDFHRFGLVLPAPRLRIMMQRGPVKICAKDGAAAYFVPVSGPQKVTIGNSEVHEQRPLLTNDDLFFDDATGQYVSLDQILGDFVSSASGTIKGFEEKIELGTRSV